MRLLYTGFLELVLSIWVSCKSISILWGCSRWNYRYIEPFERVPLIPSVKEALNGDPSLTPTVVFIFEYGFIVYVCVRDVDLE